MRSFQPVRNGYAAVEVSQSIYFYPNVTTSRLSSLALLPIWGCVIKFGSETEGNCTHACACLLCVCVYVCTCVGVRVCVNYMCLHACSVCTLLARVCVLYN